MTGDPATTASSDATVPAPSHKYEGIQVLRFVAALAVVITHATFYTFERLDPTSPVWRMGAAGVDVFFIISGFVMVVSTRPLLGSPDAWKLFGVRRLVRIVPMYWLATTVKVAVMLVLPGAALHAVLSPATVIGSYFFIPYRTPDGPVEPLLGVGWTLVFEMFFYLVFTIALLLRVSPVIFSSAVLALLAIGSLFRPAQDWPVWAFLFDPIVLYFVIGMLLATVCLSPALRRWLPAIAGGLVLLLAVLALVPGGLTFAQNSPFRFAIIALIVVAATWVEPWIGGRVPRILLFLGAASYSLYLFHPLIGPLVPELLARLGIVVAPLSIVLTIVVAIVVTAIIYRFVEAPLTRWLARTLPYGGKRPVTAVQSLDREARATR